MEALLSRSLGVDVELVVGDGGVFDVVAGGERIFSKHEAGRFPNDEEIVDAVRQRL